MRQNQPFARKVLDDIPSLGRYYHLTIGRSSLLDSGSPTVKTVSQPRMEYRVRVFKEAETQAAPTPDGSTSSGSVIF